jgi:hypothetical protein
LILVAALFLLFQPVSLKADTLTFNPRFLFSGTSPTGSQPWLTATFSSDTPGTVTLTMSSSFKDPGEFVTEWDFNLNPALDPASLSIIYNSGPSASVSKGTNAFLADGDGYFDIRFLFPTDPQESRLKGTSTSVYTIIGDSITASSFDYLSYINGGEGVYHTGAYIQGIPSGVGSGWIGNSVRVPEPGILILLGLSLTAIGVASRFVRKI